MLLDGAVLKAKARLEGLKQLGWNPVVKSALGDESDVDEGESRSKPSLSVDELMFSAVNTMRLALERHGDRARIAFAMTAGYKPMPGDRRYYFNESKSFLQTMTKLRETISILNLFWMRLFFGTVSIAPKMAGRHGAATVG